jgi:hypothetical protein
MTQLNIMKQLEEEGRIPGIKHFGKKIQGFHHKHDWICVVPN